MQRELDRFKVIQDMAGGKLKPWRAAERLELTTRQVRPLVARLREHGPEGLVPGRYGEAQQKLAGRGNCGPGTVRPPRQGIDTDDRYRLATASDAAPCHPPPSALNAATDARAASVFACTRSSDARSRLSSACNTSIRLTTPF